MIDEIHVQNIALIEEATLAPARGLTVITGETGAGKTALLCAIKLLIGERADTTMIREGSDRAGVEGRVFLDGNDTEGTVVARTLSADGRSRVHIDGSIGSVRQLAESIGVTVDLCGQHEHQRLLKTTHHRAMFDTWMAADIEATKTAYLAAWHRAQKAARAVDAIRSAGQLESDILDQARYTLRRMEEADPQEGEYEALLAKLPLLEHAEALLQATGGAHSALSDEAGALDSLNMAAALLENMTPIDASLGEAAQSLRDAGYMIEDVSRDMATYASNIDYDPHLLADMQQRASLLQDLMRTFGPTMEAVFTTWSEARQTVAAVENFEKNLAEAKAAQSQAEEELACAAHNLHDVRAKAAPAFSREVTKQMARLEMGTAELVCSIKLLERDQWTGTGADAVEFLFKPAATIQARPLAKIASGGEISRVMLAIKVVLGKTDSADTLIFDEVDSGVGGATARSLADVLADLSRTHQVIVVTHLPQVAVHGAVHYRVSKSGGKHPTTLLEPISGAAREQEIARMLSGETTKASLTHARELLAEKA